VEDRRRKEEGSRSSKPPEVGESGISIGGKGDIDGKARPEGSRAHGRLNKEYQLR